MKKIILSSIIISNLVCVSSGFAAFTRKELRDAVAQCTKVIAQDLVRQLSGEKGKLQYVLNLPEVTIKSTGEFVRGVTYQNFMPYASSAYSSFKDKETTSLTFEMNENPFEIKLNLGTNELDTSKKEAGNLEITMVPAAGFTFPSLFFFSQHVTVGSDRFGGLDEELDQISEYSISGDLISGSDKVPLIRQDTDMPTHFTLNFTEYRNCLHHSLKKSENQTSK